MTRRKTPKVRQRDSELMRLELAVQSAQSDAAFVNGSTMPVVSMMVAIIVALAVLDPEDGTPKLLLSLAGVFLVVVGVLAIWERKRVARRLIEAQYALAGWKLNRTPRGIVNAIKPVDVESPVQKYRVPMFTAYAFPGALFVVSLAVVAVQYWT